jgi:hypothetical protein
VLTTDPPNPVVAGSGRTLRCGTFVFPSLNCRNVSGPALIGGSGVRIHGLTLKVLSCPGNVTGAGRGATACGLAGIGTYPLGLVDRRVSCRLGIALPFLQVRHEILGSSDVFLNISNRSVAIIA